MGEKLLLLILVVFRLFWEKAVQFLKLSSTFLLVVLSICKKEVAYPSWIEFHRRKYDFYSWGIGKGWGGVGGWWCLTNVWFETLTRRRTKSKQTNKQTYKILKRCLGRLHPSILLQNTVSVCCLDLKSFIGYFF